MFDYLFNIFLTFLLIKSAFDGMTFTMIQLLFDSFAAFVVYFLLEINDISIAVNVILFAAIHYIGYRYALTRKKSGLYELIFGVFFGVLSIVLYLIILTIICMFNKNKIHADFFDNFFIQLLSNIAEYFYDKLS